MMHHPKDDVMVQMTHLHQGPCPDQPRAAELRVRA